MHRYLIPLVVAALVVAGGVVALASHLVAGGEVAAASAPTAPVRSEAEVAAVAAEAGPIEVHRSESCSCCAGHVDHLRGAGFDVEERVHTEEDEMPAVKRSLGVPEELWSCHTTVVDGSAIEGHVPADVIVTLLERDRDVDGVALPGMPAGAPGMPGEKIETWSFVTFTAGTRTEILTER